MTCDVCGGTMRGKTITWKGKPQQVFECNQDNGECLNDKGYPNSIWPRQGGGGGGTPGRRSQEPSSPATTRKMSKDDYWAWKQGHDLAKEPKIERQHSQHMAVILVKSKWPGGIPEGVDITGWIRELTNYFQRDIGRSPEKRQAPIEDPSDEHPMNPINQEGYDGDPADYGDESPF